MNFNHIRHLIVQLSILISIILFIGCSANDSLPRIRQNFESASVRTKGKELIVTTGQIERRWKWTGGGFLTTGVYQDNNLIAKGLDQAADWDLGQSDKGELISLKAYTDDDQHFTDEHLVVEAIVHYDLFDLKYVIWAYPGAPGLRTQIWLKDTEHQTPGVETLHPGISEGLSLVETPEQVLAYGYHAGLKANMTPYEILTEQVLQEQDTSAISSGLIVTGKDNGLILIKESQKHTHLSEGLETGDFKRDDTRLSVSGLGIRTDDLTDTEYRFCWANWLIVYSGPEINAQLALKKFDRFRYPVHPDRDIFIMANTWGSEDKQNQCDYKAREENVLREIAVCAELGVDMLQIDDGWQIRQGDSSWLPAAIGPTRPYKNGKIPVLMDGSHLPDNYPVYPNGFGKVKQAAAEAGIRLGLWHAWTAPIEAIKTNYDNGDFKSFKLDFAVLKKKDALDHLYYKARDLIKYSDYSAVVNWDVTEAPPRMGYYFGRDCGNLYLSNRKAYTMRPSVQYDPWQILRDAWELSMYMNLNKVQITYQNKDLTPQEALTDALQSTHAYNLAVTLMSSPILFTETQLISPEARAELKPIISQYKQVREEMYQGYVFAIGEKPDNNSWTGLQNYNPESDQGYLTLFRELNNLDQQAEFKLHFIEPRTTLELTNLLTGEKSQKTVNQNGEIVFEIEEAPGFLFLKYAQVEY